MKKLTFTPADSLLYSLFYRGCCADKKPNGLNRIQRREWQKMMDLVDSIGEKPIDENKTYSLQKSGGVLVLEDSWFALAKELCLDHCDWPTTFSRHVNDLEDFLDKAEDFKPQLVKE